MACPSFLEMCRKRRIYSMKNVLRAGKTSTKKSIRMIKEMMHRFCWNRSWQGLCPRINAAQSAAPAAKEQNGGKMDALQGAHAKIPSLEEGHEQWEGDGDSIQTRSSTIDSGAIEHVLPSTDCKDAHLKSTAKPMCRICTCMCWTAWLYGDTCRSPVLPTVIVHLDGCDVVVHGFLSFLVNLFIMGGIFRIGDSLSYIGSVAGDRQAIVPWKLCK